jgi:hypothetical protein
MSLSKDKDFRVDKFINRYELAVSIDKFIQYIISSNE